jgi:hypothetical protein
VFAGVVFKENGKLCLQGSIQWCKLDAIFACVHLDYAEISPKNIIEAHGFGCREFERLDFSKTFQI